MKISYAITVCNEFIEIQKLLNFLLKNKRHQDEVIILFDSQNGDKQIETFLRAKAFNWNPYKFNGHFAKFKNRLTELCGGDYIFQIDADEMVSSFLLKNLPDLLTQNDVDVVLVPRINTVEGLTQEHIQKWRWNINEKGWINFPDYQYRIYKNNGKIKWKNKVHEVLEGYKTISNLPVDDSWCLLHKKTIEKQQKQNAFYEQL